MMNTLIGLALIGTLVRADGARDDSNRAPPAALTAPATRAVDLAICLDTSGSMDGLIDAARQKLWSIVNDLALAKPTPKLRVALLTYGNDGHSAEAGWVKVDVGLTDDLDRVSQELFALTTNGGTEYVARVLKVAGEQLDWDKGADALKLAIVAGNESAEQDPTFNFRDVCKGLIERGIVVNSIYCGNPMDEIAPAWREVAKCADGQFAAIDQDHGTVVIATPFDAELAKLSGALNETYLFYGAAGAVASVNQTLQDQNAEKLNAPAAAARACTKGCGLYNCATDLVDALKGGKLKLADVKTEELPEKMRPMSLDERQKCVDAAAARRGALQKQIQELGVKRQQHLETEMSKRKDGGKGSFDHAVRDAVRQQAECKGFKFPADAPPAKSDAPKDPSKEPAKDGAKQQ